MKTMMHSRIVQWSWLAGLVPLLAAGCGSDLGSAEVGSNADASRRQACRKLDPKLAWYANNREELDEFIAQHSRCGRHDRDCRGERRHHRPVAIFDWDNTIIKNDIGDATTYWMLRHDKVLQPPDKNWRFSSPYLTDAAVTSLKAACDALADPGQPLPTSTDTACADAIISIYEDETTKAGADAFSGWDRTRIEPAYAWTVQLQAGYTPDEIHAIAEQVITENLANPIGTKQTVGTTGGLNYYIRVYDQIKDLMGALQDDGFDVWISSASSRYLVEVFARYVNVEPDHVMGVTLLTDDDDRLTSNLAGCGDVPDGTNDGAGHFTGNSMITYIDGKRCWANKVIWGDDGPGAVLTNPDLRKRALFAAGDSNTDLSFVRDAIGLKLVINRNKKALMCNGYNNYQGRYLLNPMFIQPKGQLVSGYPCASKACFDSAGHAQPCFDEGNPSSPIPDQVDSVFPGSTSPYPDLDEHRRLSPRNPDRDSSKGDPD